MAGLYVGGLDAVAAQRMINTATAQLAATIPQPATSAPPAVADNSAVGTVQQFALANHTHQSSVRANRMTVGALTGGFALVTWTFATPFADGTVPVCTATVENTANASEPFVVNLAGVPTNVSATFIVFKAQATTLGGTLAALLGAIVAPFTNAAPVIVINAVARLPSA